MPAPLNLSPDDLRDIAYALNDLTRVLKDHNVTIGAYGEMSITHTAPDGNETVLRLELRNVPDAVDAITHEYAISDRIGA